MIDIRSREIKKETLTYKELELKTITYDTSISTEVFLQFVRKTDNKIAGFLRLSFPIRVHGITKPEMGWDNEKEFFRFEHPFLSELNDCAMIREVHVYGNVVDIGDKTAGNAQHLGLGTQLIEYAKQLTKEAGYSKLAVISAIGTKDYYSNRGFELKELYQIAKLQLLTQKG